MLRFKLFSLERTKQENLEDSQKRNIRSHHHIETKFLSQFFLSRFIKDLF